MLLLCENFFLKWFPRKHNMMQRARTARHLSYKKFRQFQLKLLIMVTIRVCYVGNPSQISSVKKTKNGV